MRLQFLLEAVVLSLVGGLAGALLGVGGIYAVNALGTMRAELLPSSIPLTASVFINDDESGLHHDYGVWLEELAPHAPVSHCRPRGRLHKRTGEACPERSEGTTPTRI